MKKTLYCLSLVLATVMVLFASCAKEDEDYEDLLIGSWNSTDSWSYIFHDDHTGSRTQGVATQTFTWTLDDDELELKFDKYGEGQSQIITFRVYIVESLTSTKMEAYEKADITKETIVFTKKK